MVSLLWQPFYDEFIITAVLPVWAGTGPSLICYLGLLSKALNRIEFCSTCKVLSIKASFRNNKRNWDWDVDDNDDPGTSHPGMIIKFHEMKYF